MKKEVMISEWLEDLFIEYDEITLQDLYSRLAKYKSRGYKEFSIRECRGCDEYHISLYAYRNETEKERNARIKRSAAARASAKKRNQTRIQKEKNSLPKKIKKLSKELEKAKERLNKISEK